MSALAHKVWTREEYLAFERASEEKHEYVAGEIYSMVGASNNHNIIVANLIITIGIQLRGRPCLVYPSDIWVGIPSVGSYTYPDVTAVCGTPEFEDAEVDILLNPTVIIEVLSPSTEMYDRGKKFQNYRTLASLKEYILVSQDTHRIEQFVRQENEQWLLTDAAGLDSSITLPSINCSLALADVYDKVSFDEGE
jgi:Uma2 family endonuclease